MNRKEEKRRKFHEGLLKLLYPPPSLPPDHQATESSEEEAPSIIDLDIVRDESENERSSSSSSDRDMGFEAGKLTRAQRKRIRRAKLKEGASRRRKIIGPLLPEASDEIGVSGAEIVEEHPPCVRQNASSPVYCLPEEATRCTMKKNKLKKRRAIKKSGSASSNIVGHAK
ncbi:hypothetical protein DM860_015910 [Cuscuta australis]|uniref:Uncharacterized protein n=1 Tax=Cuscuta australis TaxID=267555 RepID=A0A328E2U3_9ASTE|nr:hypothetical protein DM860_015910 [Cuscuta australis]